MARPWSARCYGVARQRDGSRQNGIGGVFLRAMSVIGECKADNILKRADVLKFTRCLAVASL
jgi:hypothetical protein